MASYPKIDTPCPIRWNAMPSADRNFCMLCERKVHNLDAMNAVQRREFLSGCDGSVCVAYTLRPPRAALGARVGLGLAAALALSPVLAEPQDFPQQSPAQTTSLTPTVDYADCDHESTSTDVPNETFEQIIVGGVVNPREAGWVDENSVLPELPLVTSDAFLDSPASAEFVIAPAGKPE